MIKKTAMLLWIGLCWSNVALTMAPDDAILSKKREREEIQEEEDPVKKTLLQDALIANMLLELLDDGMRGDITSTEYELESLTQREWTYVDVADFVIKSWVENEGQDGWLRFMHQRYKWTHEHIAAYKGRLPHIRKYLDDGMPADFQIDKAFSLLHCAAAGGQIDMIKLLLEHGAKIDITANYTYVPRYREFECENGWTPLLIAAENGHVEAMQLLLDRGANIEAEDENCWTPLHIAAANGHVEAMRLLLDRGANIEAHNASHHDPDLEGLTPLGLVALIDYDTETPSDTSWTVEVMRLLLDRGANIEARCDRGYTPLHLAAWDCNVEALELLISRGSKIDVQNKSGYTALHIIARANVADQKLKCTAMKLLLEKRALINVQDEWGKTPLHDAAENSHAKVMDLLLDRGADIGIRDERGNRALSILAKNIGGSFGKKSRSAKRFISTLSKNAVCLPEKHNNFRDSLARIKTVLMVHQRGGNLLAALPKDVCLHILWHLYSVQDNSLVNILVERFREGRVATMPVSFRSLLADYLLCYTQDLLPKLITDAKCVTRSNGTLKALDLAKVIQEAPLRTAILARCGII